MLQAFARSIAHIALLPNITLLSINMKATWQARFVKSRKQTNQCNNSGETEEVQNSEYLQKIKKKSESFGNNPGRY